MLLTLLSGLSLPAFAEGETRTDVSTLAALRDAAPAAAKPARPRVFRMKRNGTAGAKRFMFFLPPAETGGGYSRIAPSDTGPTSLA